MRGRKVFGSIHDREIQADRGQDTGKAHQQYVTTHDRAKRPAKILSAKRSCCNEDQDDDEDAAHDRPPFGLSGYEDLVLIQAIELSMEMFCPRWP